MIEREARIKKNQRVVLKDGENSFQATITSLSKNGMSLVSENTFHTFKVIDILVKIGQKIVPIKGSIRWVNEGTGNGEKKLNEIGIALQNPPPEYLSHFEPSE
jgi:hypothetical protein